jgi:penicillin-binding protein 1A
MEPKAKADISISKRKKKQRSPVVKFIITVTAILLVFILTISCALIGIAGGAIIGYIKNTPPIPDDKLKIQTLTTLVYDKNGKQISTIRGIENIDRMIAKYDEIPKNLINAFIAIEDKRFYSNNGVDIKRSIGATINYIFHGSSSYGGSTITQQLVRAVTEDTTKSIQRKVQEWWRAIKLEQKLEKWQILELYLNLIYMGENCYGVKSAATTYFNKDLDELTLAECASLAGITNYPAYYDPFNKGGPEKNTKRARLILEEMLKSNFITQSEYDKAKSEELMFVKRKVSVSTSKQSYFVDQVIKDVINDLEAKGMSNSVASNAVYNSGLKIYTTMDSKMQASMDAVYKDPKYFPGGKNSVGKLPQSAMAVVDSSTSQVRAMYGGRGKKIIDSGLNRATQIYRQAGSSFKPIADYGPAINEHIITPATVIDDAPVYLAGISKGLYPRNFTRTYQGLVTIRYALAQSINVVAAKVWNMMPANVSFNYLEKSGIDMSKEGNYVSVALGGLTKGVNPLQMAAAYVPFDNKGVYTEPATYTKVVDSDGNVILDKMHDTVIKPQSNVVYSESTAFLMTSMLHDVTSSSFGLATYVKLHNSNGVSIPTAAKTGTTNNDFDRWFVGFTPSYSAAVWYGYDHPSEINVYGNNPSAVIWNAVLQGYYSKSSKTESFRGPSSDVVQKYICKYSGKLATDICSQDPRGSSVRTEYFIKGTEPTDYCDVHFTAKVCKATKGTDGKYLLAGQYCLPEEIIEKVFIKRVVPYVPIRKGDPYPLDWKYELPAKYCTIHNASTPVDPIISPTPPAPTDEPVPTDTLTPTEEPVPTEASIEPTIAG